MLDLENDVKIIRHVESHDATQANGICWCEWVSTLHASNIKGKTLQFARPVWIGPKSFCVFLWAEPTFCVLLWSGHNQNEMEIPRSRKSQNALAVSESKEVKLKKFPSKKKKKIVLVNKWSQRVKIGSKILFCLQSFQQLSVNSSLVISCLTTAKLSLRLFCHNFCGRRLSGWSFRFLNISKKRRRNKIWVESHFGISSFMRRQHEFVRKAM